MIEIQTRAVKVLVLATGRLLTKITGLLSAMVLVRVLTIEDYSSYRQVLLAYGTVAPFLALGLPRALLYFLPGEEKRPGGVLLENITLLSLMGFIFMCAVLFGGNQLLAKQFSNPNLAEILTLFAPYGLFILPASAFTSCMLAREKVQYVVAVAPLSALVMTTAVVIASIIGANAMYATAGAVVGAGIVFVPTVVLMVIVCRGGAWSVSFKGLWAQLNFSIPLGIAAMIGTTAANIDKLLVSSMCTQLQFALYVNGAMHLPLVGIITGSVMSVLLPDLARSYKKSNFSEAIDLWKRASVKCSLIMVPMCFFLFALAPDLMTLLYSATYVKSSIPFRFYVLLLPLSSISFSTPLLAAGKSKLTMVEATGNLVFNFLFSYAAIVVFGFSGAAAATLFTSYFWAAWFNLFMIRKYYHQPISQLLPYKILGQIVILNMIASVGFVWLFFPIASVYRLVLCALSFSGLVIGLYWRKDFVTPHQLKTFFRSRFQLIFN